MAKEAAKSKTLPKREEIPERYKWRLEDLFASREEWERVFREAQALIDQIAAYSGTLGQSGQRLLEALRLRDELEVRVERLYAYARMRRDEDATRAEHQALSDRATTLLVQAEAALSFLEPEILSIPEERLRTWLEEVEGLALYQTALENLLVLKPHVRSAEVERLLAEAGELADAPRTVYGMLSDADLRFPTIRDERGDEVELTKGRYLTFLESADRRVRREAFTALYRVYESKIHTFAALFAASVKKDVFFARARNYRSALEAALTPNRIPVAVYTQLIDTVRRHLPLLHRYLALRKKALGLDELHMYDLYVPLARLERTVPYEKAAELVTRALAVLGNDYVRVLKEAFASRWIDVYENRGKRSGAYSWGAYGTHPYILLNYQGTLHDVFTLAHEMGHALHSHYSWTHQPYVYAHYRIFVAEVASTVNEILLVRYLLERTTDPTERLALLHHQLEQFRTTVFRQTMFAEFEKWAHEQVEGGQPLTAETLCARYRKLNEEYHGPAVMVDPQIAYEWARIPHFYSPFYVYQYATGYAAAIALAQGILERPKEAVPRYLAFLKAGSSDTPIALLQRAGVDMTRPEPIEKALAVFAGLVDELERLVGA